ncbi:uncharacterized protein LOC136027647 isoform X1 [Artemia franciscana]|uniref:uncharacterized protein LOC136027647 isoform X1 n=1 Tax=Artemia franciscana TaxID=6661 RepID=UPI0032D9C66D
MGDQQEVIWYLEAPLQAEDFYQGAQYFYPPNLYRTQIELQEEGPIYNICYNGVNGLYLSFPAVPSAMPVPVQPVPDLFFHSTCTSIGNHPLVYNPSSTEYIPYITQGFYSSNDHYVSPVDVQASILPTYASTYPSTSVPLHQNPSFTTRGGANRLELGDHVYMDFTDDLGFIFANNKLQISVSVAGHRGSIAVSHPLGTLLKRGNRCESTLFHEEGEHRYVKFWHMGISFGLNRQGIAYLLDKGGVRTKFDTFNAFRDDMITKVSEETKMFRQDVYAGKNQIQSAIQEESINMKREMVAKSPDGQISIQSHDFVFYLLSTGEQVWWTKTLTIVKREGGTLEIFGRGSDENANLYLKSCARTASLTLQIPNLHLTTSLNCNNLRKHFYFRHSHIDTKRVHYDGVKVAVRLNGQEASLDENGQLELLP